VAVSFIGGGNQIVWRKTDLPQVTDELYHIMLCTSPRSRLELNISGDRHWLHR